MYNGEQVSNMYLGAQNEQEAILLDEHEERDRQQ